MGLVQVATNTVTSNVAVVTLTGIDDSSAVYMVAFNDVYWQTNDDMRTRVTVGGTIQTNTEYDIAGKFLYHDNGFGNTGGENGSSWDLNQGTGTSSSYALNGIYYLYNFANSSEFSYITVENVHRNTSQNRTGGFQGGAVRTSAENNDGISFFGASDNDFANGTFTLYKVT